MEGEKIYIFINAKALFWSKFKNMPLPSQLDGR